ncbi:HNH endonuclease [Salmonella enterica]|nr:HNH endonuclease [Salmonella enterica]
MAVTRKVVNELMTRSGVVVGGPFTKAIREIIKQAMGQGKTEDWIIKHVPTTDAFAVHKGHKKAPKKKSPARAMPLVPAYRRGEDPRFDEWRKELAKQADASRKRREAWEAKMSAEAAERNQRNEAQRKEETKALIAHEATVEDRVEYIQEHIPTSLMREWALWVHRHNEGQPITELVAAFLMKYQPAPAEPVPAPVVPNVPARKPSATPRQHYALTPTEEKYREIKSRARRQQSAWAKIIKEAGICWVTGSREGLEAAHIKPFSICTAAEAVSLDNGVCLTATVHKMFDSITSIDQIPDDEPMRKIMDMDKFVELLELRNLMLADDAA